MSDLGAGIGTAAARCRRVIRQTSELLSALRADRKPSPTPSRLGAGDTRRRPTSQPSAVEYYRL